jgi:hypothetical protein
MSMTSMGYEPVPLSQRIPRRPRHFFTLKHRPWQIQPFLIAPVLAGETMQNLLLQTRAITDPLKHPLVGWWMEHFIWFVKLRDIEYTGGVVTYPDVEKMLFDPLWDFTTSNLYSATAVVPYYKAANSIDWVGKCVARVTETFFRLDGEANNIANIGGMFSTSIWEDEQQNSGANWANSLTDVNSVTYDTGINVDLNADTVITTAEIDQAMKMWQYQVYAQTTTLSFTEYLAQFGVRMPVDDLHRPELLRFTRSWQLPSNTVDPLTGTPTSAVSWSIAERADKDRFFSEPGFIFGATVARPKVYWKGQTDAAVQMMTNTFAWLPQVMMEDPQTSFRTFKGGAAPTGKTRGPLGGNSTNDYIVDVRDLFLYGDQFTNYALGAADSSVSLPTASLNKRYAVDGDADALFKTATVNTIRQDGVVNLTILGTQTERSPQGVQNPVVPAFMQLP